MKKIILLFIFSLLFVSNIKAQFTDGMTGLLHLVNAEIQNDATFMIGGNMLHKYNLPSDEYWTTAMENDRYNTYNYYINLTLFDRIEVSYICTLLQGRPGWPSYTYHKFVNQDRHFAGKVQLVKEGEWWEHMPAIAVGVSDPTTGTGGDYAEMGVDGAGNGFFNRWFAAVTKHFTVKGVGELGLHATYLKNKRTDYPLNDLAYGVNFRPAIHKNLNIIAEYDAKTFNVGAIYSLWADHFNFLFELQDGKYVSCGLVYKVNLKGGNRWKSGIFSY